MAVVAMRRLAAGLLFASSVSGFKPFADVEELAPHRLDGFCGPKDPKTGRAICRRLVEKRLDDDGDLRFNWEMELDPDSFLSIDTERAEGVKLLSCDAKSVELELPEAYARHAKPGQLIVASSFAHRCPHLARKHMFKKVIQVQKLSKSESSKTSRVHLLTKDLPSFSHCAHKVNFQFSYMPSEARDIHNEFPEMKTRRHRRLSDYDTNVIDGNPQEYNPDPSGGVDIQNSLINFEPNQLSNFGWNWNFYMNSTEEPEFNYSIPGIEGYMKLKQPYIKVHAGIYLNFSSAFGEIIEAAAPKVHWIAGIHAHGDVNARMMTDMKTTGTVSEDAFHLFSIPQLEKLEETQWLEEMPLSMGGFSLTVEPGIQFKAEMYHTGNFDGTLQLGGKTHFVTLPEMIFSSDTGLYTTLKADFQKTTMYPPLWIISTQYFEMGFMFEPTMWMKGDFGGSQDAQVGFEGRPYLNLTISRESSMVAGDDMKTLIVYPFRVIGLGSVHFMKKYKVKVEVNAATLESTPELNWGEVEITDHMSTFNAGNIPQEAVLTNPITLSLIEVDVTTDAETTVGTAQVTCGTLTNGECQPDPAIATMEVDGAQVTIELAMLWMDNPVPWFASRIRGIGLSFPNIALNSAALATTVPELASGATPTQKMYLRVTHASKTYVTEIAGLANYSTAPSSLSGAAVIEFGPTFIDSWIPCGEDTCESGKVELIYGTQLIGTAKMPEIPWTSLSGLATEAATTDVGSESPSLDQMMGSLSGGDPGGAAMQSAMLDSMKQIISTSSSASAVPQNIPLSISLLPASGSGTNVAVVHAQATVIDPSLSSSFITPAKPSEVTLGQTQNFVWTIAYVVQSQTYSFRLSTWKDVPSQSGTSTATASYPNIGDTTLTPVPNSQQEHNAMCAITPISGVETESSPCSFSKAFTFDPSSFAVNDRVVLMLEWIDGGVDHVMYSPPFLITAATGGRRLASKDTTKPRRLWTADDWNARLAANEASCNDQDLHFEVGWGMLARAKMQDDAMPMLEMMPQGMSNLMSTGFQKIGSQEDLINSDMDHLLPPELCADGVCSGKMPGCTEANFQTMYFPTLVFNFNRDFKYSDMEDNGTIDPEMMKMAMSYAFSSLPEVVELILESINSTNTTTPMPFLASTTASLSWGTAGAAGNPYAAPTAPALSTPAPGLLPGGRRLRSSPEEPPRRSGHFSRRVTMRFKKGVHYIIDRPLVDMMMRHGMFQEIEDDLTKEGHGPLFITDYEVYSDSEGKVGALDDSPNRAVERPWFYSYTRNAKQQMQKSRYGFGLIVLGGITGIAALASVVVMRSKGLSTDPEEEEENMLNPQVNSALE